MVNIVAATVFVFCAKVCNSCMEMFFLPGAFLFQNAKEPCATLMLFLKLLQKTYSKTFSEDCT